MIRVAALASIAVLALQNVDVRAAAGLQSGIDLRNLDRTCKPCSDFFQFANGGWIENNPIPAAYPGWGSFNQLAADALGRPPIPRLCSPPRPPVRLND
jgi:Peptidase family M13